MITPLLHRERSYVPPWRALTVAVVAIFATEAAVMFLEYVVPGAPDLPEAAWALLDASILVAVTFPVLFVMFFRPIREHMAAQHDVEVALRNANEFRELVTESATNAIYALDLSGRFSFVNRRTSEISGYLPEELLGASFDQLFDAETLARVQEQFAAVALRGERVSEFEVDLRRKDGSSVVITFSIAPLIVDGAISGVVGTAEDVTDRKRAEAALRASEERLQLIFEWTPDLITWLDSAGKLVLANSASRAVLGYEPEALRGQNVLALIHPDDLPRAIQRLGALIGEPEVTPEIHVFRMRSSSGGWVPLEMRALPLPGASGLLVVSRDVTARLAQEEALRAANEFRDLVMEHTRTGIAAFDTHGRFTLVNRRLCEIFDRTAEELVGRMFRAAVDPAQHAWATELFGGSAQGRPVSIDNARLLTGAGREVVVNIAATPLVVDGALAGVVATVEDVTERWLAEEAIRQSEALLRESQSVARLGSYTFDAANGSWTSSALLDEIFGIGEAFPRDIEGWASILATDSRADMVEYLLSVVQQGLRFDREYRIVRQDTGEERWVHGFGEVEQDRDGNPIRMVGTIQDITERHRTEVALHESQRAQVTLMGNLPGMAYRCRNDRDWTLEFVSDGCYTLTGYTVGEFLAPDGVTYNSIIHPDDRDSVWEEVQRAVGRREPFELSYRINTAWGEERRTSEHGQGVFDDEGELLALEGFVMDVTDRWRALGLVRQSEERYRQLVEASPNAIIVHENRQVRYANAAAVGLLGASSTDALVGREIRELLAPGDLERAEEAARLQSASSTAVFVELQLLRLDGTPVEVELSSSAAIFEGRPATQSVARDITERKRAEALLRENEERYRVLVETSPVAMVVTSTGGRIAYLNRALARMILVEDPASLIGHDLAELIHQDSLPLLAQRQSQLAGGAISLEPVELTLVRRNGEPFPAEAATVRTIFDGEPMYVSVARDLSEQKQAEEERRVFERRLLESAKLESLGVLAGGVAHDFNNLLVTIMGNASLSAMEVGEVSPARPYLQEIETAAMRAADLARQMLAYSGKGRLLVSQVDVTGIVREMGHLVGASVPRNVRLEWHLADDLPVVEVDATQLRQVVMNLIINAAEAIGGHDGSICVSTSAMHANPEYFASTFMAPDDLKEGEYVYFEVSDTGLGMDEETRARMFDPFFTTKFTGRGLGMAAVLGIVRGHKGAIRVESTKGRGTTIRVLLPAAETHTALAAQAVEPAASVAPAAFEGTVLVVDDEEGIRMVASRMLDRLGLDVLTAGDGQAALEIFRERHEDLALVLLDLTMPQLGGVEAFEEMRAIGAGVPVVVMSGFGPEEALGKFRQPAPNAFLQKPFALKDLEEVLSEVFRSGGLNESPDIPYPEGERRLTMEKITDGPITIVVAGPVGFGNNIYVVIDRDTGEAAFVDAPGDAVANLDAAEFGGVRPSKILLTHSHGDHTPAIDDLKRVLGCKLYASVKEPWLKPGQIDVEVSHGDELMVGNLALRVIGVPGHTPGSVAYVYGKHVFVGDTVFPGGPGRSVSNAALQEEIASITNRLYPLPDDTVAYPGHGGQTTIGESRSEYAVFAAKEHDPELHGDVSWLES